MKKGKKLVSDGLFIRLLTIYRQDVLYEDPAEIDFVSVFEKSLAKSEIVTEGDETKAFMKIINGKEETTQQEDSQSSASEGEEEDDDIFDEEDLPLIKYESPFMKKLLVPQEPRLFCLLYNSQVVDYSDSSTTTNNELMITKTQSADSMMVNLSPSPSQ